MADPQAGAPRSSSRWAPVSVASIVAAEPPAAPTPAPAIDHYVDRIIGGKYRIIDRLGAGGMAVVYRAQEKGMLTREVAIKVLTPESALSQTTITRFLKEAQAISDVGHTNVVQLIELGCTDEGQIYLVMERLVGKTLYEVLKDMGQRGETFTWERLAPIILDIGRALQAAHKQKIIHRDIKPSNVFCCDSDDDQWHIKVLDFGIAKVQGVGNSNDSLETPLTQEGMFIGTPHYAAPEIINRLPEHTIDGRVDIFALGVIMYQCLTGTLPFQDLHNDRLALMYKAARERPVSPRQRAPDRDIPIEVEAVIMRAMEVNPEDRYRSVSELRDAIKATFRNISTSGSRNVLSRSVELTPPPPSITPDLLPARPEPADKAPPEASARPKPTQPPVESPTVQSPTRQAKRGALAALAAMLLGLVVLVALVVHEFSVAPPPARPAPARPPVPARGLVTPGPVTPVDAVPEPEDLSPQAVITARRDAIRERLDVLAGEAATRRCLPSSTKLADGIFDELPVLVEVDPDGAAKASIPIRTVERRVAKAADLCMLEVLATLRFVPGPGSIKVSHTLRFD